MANDPRRGSRLVQPDNPLRRAFATAALESTEDLIEAAYRKGLAEGETRGRQAAEAEAADRLDEVRQNLAEAIDRLAAGRQEMLREGRDTMVALALEAAGKMLRRAVEQDEPLAARALEEVLAALPTNREFAVRVHPEDLDSIREALGERIAERKIRLEQDRSISRGGCIVDASADAGAGTIDATFETAEQSIREAAIEPGTGTS